jgi:hypothetical protein
LKALESLKKENTIKDNKKIQCIICGKELPIDYYDVKCTCGRKIKQYTVYDGIEIDNIHVGFGSDHDYEILKLAICDDCIDKNQYIKQTGTYT